MNKYVKWGLITVLVIAIGVFAYNYFKKPKVSSPIVYHPTDAVNATNQPPVETTVGGGTQDS